MNHGYHSSVILQGLGFLNKILQRFKYSKNSFIAGAHPGSYPMGTSGSSSGSRAAGTWSWSLTWI